MPRSPSPDRRSERSHHSSSRRHRDDRDHETRRRSRSPARRDEPERLGSRRSGKERERSRSRSRSRSRDRSERHHGSSSSRRRERSTSRDRHHHHRSSGSRRRRERSRSSSSGSDSDDSRDSGRRRSKHRSSSSREGETDRERRRRRQEKKDRKAKREAKRLAKKGIQKVEEFGKHGILTEADIYTKSDEFHAWLIQERMLNPETLTKQKEKEVFKSFMEDFNTCTLPHEKYYDMKKYETKMAAVRMGETVEDDGNYDFAKDLQNAKQSYRRAAAASNAEADALLMDRERLEELRKLQAERIEMEKMQRLGLEVKASMGIRMEKR